MTITRTHTPMTNEEVKTAARKNGYYYKSNWKCDACEEEATANGTLGRPYVNVSCALKFTKKGSTVAACGCGWRKNITIKFVPKESFKCVSCGSKLNNAHDWCYNRKCADVVPQSNVPSNQGYPMPAAQQTIAPVVPTKVCSRPGCNNPGPEGRKTVCDTCRATPKEPVSDVIYQ